MFMMHRLANLEPDEGGGAKAGRKGGYSLIELLASMVILVIIVGVMGMIFSESDKSWAIGTGRAQNNSVGRAALNMMAHDLQYGVADEIVTFKMSADRHSMESFDFANGEICVVSLQNDSSNTNRTAREVHYYVRQSKNANNDVVGYELVRGYYSPAIMNDHASHCYWNPGWYNGSGGSPPGPGRPPSNDIIAEHVTGVAFFAPDESGAITEDYYSVDQGNQLPEYVDIFLEVLDERSAGAVADMMLRGVDCTEFVERNARRYTTRVYFHNRYGYKPR
jgi:prepilin-type N-terminal cleavage/methylation domain-containing protein